MCSRRQRWVLEETEIEHRHPLVHLEQNERDERDGCHREQREDPGRRPAVRVRLDQPVGEREEPDGGGDEPGQVESLFGEVSRDSRITSHAARIARVPTGTFMKKIQFQSMCWEMRPPRVGRSRAPAGGPGPDADRRPSLPRGKGDRDDRERRGVHERRADSLDDAGCDQHLCAPRKPAGQRGEGEDGEPGNEDPAAAEHVGEFSARQHDGCERERVTVHDPLELRDADLKAARDRGQRNVHDRVVEHDHEEPERHRPECPPLPVLLVKSLARTR